MKRKSVAFEDDPSYSEGEEEDEILEHHKKVPGYRCSPHLVPELFEKLSAKQKGWVKNIEFDSLDGMIDSRMTKSLTMWLVDRVDTTNGTLDVCGTPIDIRDGIVRMLKLPSGDIKVPPPLNGRSKTKRGRGDTSRTDLKHSDNGRGQTAKDATRLLLEEDEDEVEFCKSFVMLVLCIYLAPTTSLNINRSYYPALMDVSKIPLMDWCGFIAEYLIQGIEDYRKSKASHVQVAGCVHVLPLLYLDALIEMKALKLPEALTLPEGEPRIHFIGTEHLAFLASADVKARSKDHVEYGLLQDNNSSFCSVVQKCKIQVGSSKRYEKLVPNDISFQTADRNENPKKFLPVLQNLAADMIANLFSELKENRDLLWQELKMEMKASDAKIFNKFRSRFVQQFTTTPKQTTSQHKSVGTTSTSTTPAESNLAPLVEDVPSHVLDRDPKEAGLLCFSGKNRNPDLCFDDLEQVVNIGLADAMEAKSSQKMDTEPKNGAIPLSILSDAATFEYHAMYDHSPTEQNNTSCGATTSIGMNLVTRGSSMATSNELSMMLLIDAKEQKVYLAEAGSDVVELLSSLLSLPLGTVTDLLSKERMVGSIGNMLGSMEKLDVNYKSKGLQLSSAVGPATLSLLQQLLGTQLQLSNGNWGNDDSGNDKGSSNRLVLYTCEGQKQTCAVPCVDFLSAASGSICPGCSCPMKKATGQMLVNAEGSKYTVGDDLTVTQASNAVSSVVALLTRHGFKDLKEKTVKIGKEEALGILTASLKSKTVLTDVFLRKMYAGCKRKAPEESHDEEDSMSSDEEA